MRPRPPFAALASIVLLSGFQSPEKPDAALAAIVTTYLGLGLPTDWAGIEKLPNTKWAALPPTELRNCLPDGGCYARQGSATLGGRSVTLVATGARTMVASLYFRNTAAAIGEAAVLAALKDAGLTAELARCPVRAGVGGTSWYRLKGQDASAFLSVQPRTAQRPTEGFVLSYGDELPKLQPNQVALYSEQCGEGAARQPVSTMKPHEALAEGVVSLLALASGPALADWKAFADLPTGVTWDSTGPKKVNRSALGDPNPMMLSGFVTYGGRKFSMAASGTPTQVKAIFFDEQGTHPRGEHMLGVVYEKGIIVKLVRCGPVYTESTHMWYSLTSPKTAPAMIRQSIRYDGNQVNDTYELRLDGTLPARDPRDRNPGSNGC